MKLRVLLAMFTTLLSAFVASAQVTASGTTGVFVGWGGSNPSASSAPFSADVVNITDRILPDGNRIHQETRGKTMRDSQGRTREEIPTPDSAGGNISLIVISDPVQQKFITLDPNTKTAQVRELHRFNPVANSTKPGVPNVTAVVPQDGNQPQVSHSTERLGTRNIEGLNATGTRYTAKFPAGAMGNERPLTTMIDTWYSAELNTMVLTLREDPQSGKSTRRLENIQRGEPDITLFEVPPDYSVNETQ